MKKIMLAVTMLAAVAASATGQSWTMPNAAYFQTNLYLHDSATPLHQRVPTGAVAQVVGNVLYPVGNLSIYGSITVATNESITLPYKPAPSDVSNGVIVRANGEIELNRFVSGSGYYTAVINPTNPLPIAMIPASMAANTNAVQKTGDTMTGALTTTTNPVRGYAFGMDAGGNSTLSGNSIVVGAFAGQSITAGNANAFGQMAANGAISDSFNAFGSYTAGSATGSGFNAYGSSAGTGTRGNQWNAYGHDAGDYSFGNAWGAYGYDSYYKATGSYSHAFGYASGWNSDGSWNTFLGSFAGLYYKGSNTLIIDVIVGPTLPPRTTDYATNAFLACFADSGYMQVGKTNGTIALRGTVVLPTENAYTGGTMRLITTNGTTFRWE